MILGVPSRPGLRIMVACTPVDFRKGMDSLAALVTQALAADPFAGDVFIFRSRRSTRLKLGRLQPMPHYKVPAFILHLLRFDARVLMPSLFLLPPLDR